METEYRLIGREIAKKGTAYMLIRRCRPEVVHGLLKRAAGAAAAQGAKRMLAASLDPSAPLAEGVWDGLKLTHAHDMHVLERALEGGIPAGALALVPLKPDRREEWLARYNEGFFHVPNSATYEAADLDALLEEGRLCGFARAEGQTVGVYELDLTGQVPEISGIALAPAFRGLGLGRRLLQAVLARLLEEGARRCRLTVSTGNPTAYGLYLAEDFHFLQVKSRWFDADLSHAPAGEGPGVDRMCIEERRAAWKDK